MYVAHDLRSANSVLFSIIIVSIDDILGYHKISVDTLNTLARRKYRYSKKIVLSMLPDQTSVESF